MAEFAYTAKDKTGAFTKGTIEARDRGTAADTLAQKGLVPVKIGKTTSLGQIDVLGWRGVPLIEKVVFARQLSAMINAGLPIAQSLHILATQTKNKKMAETIASITKDVEGGVSFGNALAKHPKTFSQVFISMVKAGETGGILDEIMDRLATQLEREHSLVSKIRGAMIYPGVILSAMIVMFILMMTLVIPQLVVILQQTGGTLPLPTKILIAISQGFTKYGIFTGIGFVAIVVGFFRFIHTKNGKYIWHRILLRMPVAGSIIIKINVARFTRTLGALMAGGIPVVEAMLIVADTSTNVVFRQELIDASEQVKNGVPISKSLEKSKYYPTLVKEMLAVGEETGSMSALLTKLADFYDEELDGITKNLTSIIEPVLILTIGVVVGFIVVAIIVPIYNIDANPPQ
jgi:type IV pilus assembly protein PilC